MSSRRDEVSVAQHAVLGFVWHRERSPVGAVEASIVLTGLDCVLGGLPEHFVLGYSQGAPTGRIRPSREQETPADSVMDPPAMSFDVSPFRHLYPFESRWLDLDGLRMHYLDEGVGQPIVMVHGNPTWSFYFRKLVKEFRSTHRAVAIDHIGCGLSDKPGDARYEYTLERRVTDLETLLDRLGINENLTLVGHDWGGMIAVACALRQMERVKRIVLFNTAGFLLPAGKRLPWQLRLIRNAPLLPDLLVRGLNAFAVGATYLATAKGLPADVRNAYRAPYDSWRNRIATLRFVEDIPVKPRDRAYALAKWVDDHVERLRTLPVFIGWGARDFVFDRDFLAEWRRRLPKAEIHVCEDAGHYVLEDAGERLIPKLREFIDHTTPALSASTGAEAAR